MHVNPTYHIRKVGGEGCLIVMKRGLRNPQGFSGVRVGEGRVCNKWPPKTPHPCQGYGGHVLDVSCAQTDCMSSHMFRKCWLWHSTPFPSDNSPATHVLSSTPWPSAEVVVSAHYSTDHVTSSIYLLHAMCMLCTHLFMPCSWPCTTIRGGAASPTSPPPGHASIANSTPLLCSMTTCHHFGADYIFNFGVSIVFEGSVQSGFLIKKWWTGDLCSLCIFRKSETLNWTGVNWSNQSSFSKKVNLNQFKLVIFPSMKVILNSHLFLQNSPTGVIFSL